MKYLITCFALLLSTFSMADQVKSFGEYDLHFNTFESTFLTPAIATQYGFTRSKGLGLLNVAVTKNTTGQLPSPQPAIVTGTVTNLIGQIVKLSFVTIDEGDAIYYIATFTKTNDEILRFSINAKLNADAVPMSADFQRHVYVEK
ncbi:DUF4426 domain-containing protein [Marinomonas sp. 2405UD68-3]|uniref:DUF4426 domain-containing protein n=1 Tax=Marinomonas sp. 2405UD68-3 TaxID=3391835 RepID=UPI0039C8C260